MTDESEHLVKSFDQELKRLRTLLIDMGGMVESQVALATDSVVNGDPMAATRTVELDPQVDALEREVDQSAIRMLALRQPMAGDLRHVVASMKITGELERVGDYASNIAKRSMVLGQLTMPYSMTGLGHMGRLVQENLKSIIDAIGEADSGRAYEVWHSDLQIDNIYNAIFRELITYMMEDPRNITACTHLLFIAKNFERIGDHATNIAEILYYAVTGETLPETRPKGDSSAYAMASSG